MEITRKRTLTDPQRSLVGFHHLFHQLQRLLPSTHLAVPDGESVHRAEGVRMLLLYPITYIPWRSGWCGPKLVHPTRRGSPHQPWCGPKVDYPTRRGLPHQPWCALKAVHPIPKVVYNVCVYRLAEWAPGAKRSVGYDDILGADFSLWYPWPLGNAVAHDAMTSCGSRVS